MHAFVHHTDFFSVSSGLARQGSGAWEARVNEPTRDLLLDGAGTGLCSLAVVSAYSLGYDAWRTWKAQVGFPRWALGP